MTCSDRTWNETIYVIWNINMRTKDKMCRIAFNLDAPPVNNCTDGKSLYNTSRGQSYLHIPNMSNNDIGSYSCESVYRGGKEVHMINMDITGKNKTTVEF